MKKYYGAVFMLISSISVFGNDLLGQIESDGNPHTPVKTVESVFKSRGDIQQLSKFIVQDVKIIDGVYKRIQNLSRIDFSNPGQVKICKYIDQSNKLIKANFFKKKTHWIGGKIFSSNNKVLKVQEGIFNKKYDLFDEENCFISFVDTWNKVYPNALLQHSDEEFIVSNVLVEKGGQVLNAVFTLKYIQPTQESFKSGWLISSLKLKNTKNKIIQARPIPSREDGFFIKESIPYNPHLRLEATKGRRGLLIQDKNQKVKLLGLTCNQYSNKIRVAFNLDKNIHINSLLREESGKNFFGFDMVTTKKTVQKLGNCSYLKIEKLDNDLLYLNLEEFEKNINSIKYGSGSKANKSFIDLYFDKEVSLLNRLIN